MLMESIWEHLPLSALMSEVSDRHNLTTWSWNNLEASSLTCVDGSGASAGAAGQDTSLWSLRVTWASS